MELKDFINETLTQIIDGVRAAQKYASLNDAEIVPDSIYTGDLSKPFMFRDRKKYHVDYVDFEVGLTEADSKEKEGGVAVAFGLLSGGAKRKSDLQNVSVTSIRFSVPLILPKQTLKV